MVLHAALSSEDVVAVAAGADVLILVIYAIQSSWFNEDGGTRMTNAILLKKLSFILVNDMPWYY